MAVILIGGGARSGKSGFALNLARKNGGRLAFVATAQALDPEMAERIRRHQDLRSSAFLTIESPLDLTNAIRSRSFDCMIVDCLTLWLSNIMLAGRDVDAETEALAHAAEQHEARLIFVTNEVGCGIVPENDLARTFRDHAGRLNQRMASLSAEVYWMIFGHPLRVK